MARYEGMDELLDRVRRHLDVVDDGKRGQGAAYTASGTTIDDESYEVALEHLLLLMHDAEQLSARLSPGRVHGMTEEQQNDLRAFLRRVLQMLTRCQDELDRFSQPLER